MPTGQVAFKPSATFRNKPIRSLFDGFDEYHRSLRGAPGRRVSGIETVQGARRVRYENGAIYERPDRYVWVHGAIEERYNLLGNATSWLGLPLSEELDMPEGGRASVFDRGTIYWWPDAGAVALGDVVVQYTGLLCIGETDSDGLFSDSDEPFVVMGVTTPRGGAELRSQIYEDVDADESRPDLIELYRGQPLGVSIAVVLVEHDEGDPNKYRAIVGQAVDKGMDKLAPVLAKALGPIPVLGPVLAVAAQELLPLAVPAIADFLNDALGTDDDVLGQHVIQLSAKQMILLAAQGVPGDEHGITFKLQTPVFSGQNSTYIAYFNLVPA